MGKDLMPIYYDIMMWGFKHDAEIHGWHENDTETE
jgi:hypothetical protein